MSSYYWHNIGSKIGDFAVKQEWWAYLLEAGEISAGFENDPDRGKDVPGRYEAGDTMIACAPGFGAIGCGIIENPASYVHLQKGDARDRLGGIHLHRLTVRWKAVIPSLLDAVPVSTLKEGSLSHHYCPAKDRTTTIGYTTRSANLALASAKALDEWARARTG